MAVPIGLASFPGISTIIGAEMTLSHGASPSTALITTVPHTNFVASVGDLKFSFGGFRLKFPNCLVDSASLRVDSTGKRWSLRILDRRWKWQFGEIGGVYNTRKKDGTIDAATKKTPQELAEMLLRAMGEVNYDLSDLPNKSHPEIVWDYANPAQELASLCDSLACRVVLDIDNRVYLRRIGKGARLPIGGVEMNASFGFKRDHRPDSLTVLGGPVYFQSRLKLEAVGEDVDGKIKPIAKLSYVPHPPSASLPTGWEGSIPRWINIYSPSPLASVVWLGGQTYKDAGGVRRLVKDLALQSVYKWYRVVSMADDSLQIPGFGDIKDVKQIHINDFRLDSNKTPGGQQRHYPAEITGVYDAESDIDLNTTEDGTYKGGFSIDKENRLVKFNDLVTKLNKTSADPAIENRPEPADLLLTTSYHIQPEIDQPLLRYSYMKKLPGKRNGTGSRILRHPEIMQVIRRYDLPGGANIFDNQAEVDKEAKYYLDRVAEEYALEPSEDVQYAGLVSVRLDGAIQQVTWSVGGGGPATTRASRNAEHDLFTPKYEDAREKQQIKKTIDSVDGLRSRAPGIGSLQTDALV